MSRLLPPRNLPHRALLVAATAFVGILAGASLDQSIKQLPARRRIGVLAFARYSQASDLASGVPWYASLGIGSAVLTLAAAARTLLGHGAPYQRWPLLVAAVLTGAHTFTTARAAPLNFSHALPATTKPRSPRSSDASSVGRRYGPGCNWPHSW